MGNVNNNNGLFGDNLGFLLLLLVIVIVFAMSFTNL